MLAHSLVFAPARFYRQLLWLTVTSLLIPLFLVVLPPLVQRDRAVPTAQDAPTTDAPVAPAPTTQQLPPGLGPILSATLAADSAQDYAPVALASPADGLRADNPAQRFATTFGADGVNIAPASGAAFSLHAAAIITANGSIALPTAQPISTGPRVEYRRDGLTEWYVNGPRGLEQGFTLDAPPIGAERFTMSLAVSGAVPTQTDNGLVIGDLRYSSLTVTDVASTTLPAHLDLADGTIRIVVDARGAQWPVTIDPLFSQSTTLTPQTPAGSTASFFGQSSAIAAASGTNTVVVGAPSESVSGQSERGAVYVFTGSGSTYLQRARLTATDGASQNKFGQSVAVTISGGTTTVVVGTFNVGKAYVYTSSNGGVYSEQARLVSPDPTNGDNFGVSVATATNSGATIIAVGAPGHNVGTGFGRGSVYLFAGSGASYPQQTELTDSSGRAGENFGAGVALVSNGGTNTLAVGVAAKSVSSSGFLQGAVTLFTGSGTSYNSVDLSPSTNGLSNNYVGYAIAVGVLNGITTVAAGASPGMDPGQGAVYVFAGSGTSYTMTTLTDAKGAALDQFGRSVAVGYSYSQTLVAVGAAGKNGNTGNPADGVLIFTQNGASYSQSSLPELNGAAGDHYGSSVAMQAVSNGDPVVVGGAFGNLGGAPQTGTATVSSWSAQASVQATFGDGAQMLASPAASNYSGTPFHLVASVVDGNGNAIPPTGVTFTVNPSGTTGGLFIATDPNSTTLPVLTRDGTNGTTAGQTDRINLFPSSTAGDFTVTVTADGTALSATYALTIIATAPKPTINPVIPVRTTNTAKQSPKPNAVTTQPPGLSPAMVIIDSNVNYEIHVNGSGFVSQALGTTSFFKHGTDPPIQMDTVYNSSTELLVFVSGPNGMFAGLSADTTATITVRNPPSSQGAGDGGDSAPVTIVLAQRRAAPTNSALACSGSTTIFALSSSLIVAPPCQVVDRQGHVVPGIATGIATGFVGIRGGEIIAQGGGNIIAQGGGNIIAQGGGNIIAQGGGNLITNDGGSIVASGGGNIVQNGAAQPASQAAPAPDPVTRAVQTSGRVAPHTVSSITGDYIASTDAHGIIMAPPVLSNGIPGTFTRTLSVDGITAGVTYTITNLNPHDGHPTTITSLSRTTASVGDPAFTLTVTGTGFIGGSVISYGGVQLVTTFDFATRVHATVPAALLNYIGPKDVLVINPDPNGGASLPATFTVTRA
nr:FG-GAP repeat protein [Chloroflexota bacterium]